MIGQVPVKVAAALSLYTRLGRGDFATVVFLAPEQVDEAARLDVRFGHRDRADRAWLAVGRRAAG